MSATVPGTGSERPTEAEAQPVEVLDLERAEREQAVANLKRRRKFADDAMLYVAVNGVLWLIWALADRSHDGWPWPAYVSLIWGFVLAVDAWRAYGPWPGSLRRPITERDVEQEIRRNREP